MFFLKTRRRRPQRSKNALQDRPEGTQDGPGPLQNRSENRFQDFIPLALFGFWLPRRRQDVPKTFSRRPWAAPGEPKKGQDPPKTRPRRCKTAKHAPKTLAKSVLNWMGFPMQTHPYMTGEPLPAQTWPRSRAWGVPKSILTGFDLT